MFQTTNQYIWDVIGCMLLFHLTDAFCVTPMCEFANVATESASWQDWRFWSFCIKEQSQHIATCRLMEVKGMSPSVPLTKQKSCLLSGYEPQQLWHFRAGKPLLFARVALCSMNLEPYTYYIYYINRTCKNNWGQPFWNHSRLGHWVQVPRCREKHLTHSQLCPSYFRLFDWELTPKTMLMKEKIAKMNETTAFNLWIWGFSNHASRCLVSIPKHWTSCCPWDKPIRVMVKNHPIIFYPPKMMGMTIPLYISSNSSLYLMIYIYSMIYRYPIKYPR